MKANLATVDPVENDDSTLSAAARARIVFKLLVSEIYRRRATFAATATVGFVIARDVDHLCAR